ncbi:hypothetical protein [Compostimonas suwonensis]|uniref:hypothetical protein n=1 Tax=Compostimonas suwonensis TaxID=1048394 RepID=UPI0012FE3A6D|nr:hypothetical protein [Compostimonas suwonensis]
MEITAEFDGESASELELSDAFDRGMDMVRAVQRAYYLATQDAVSLIVRETLPTMILFTQSHDTADVTSGVFITHGPGLRASVVPDSLSREQLERLGGILSHLTPGGVFWSYADLRREAQVALWLRGDYRSAVLAAATAAEVYLDTVLLHMLWMEGAAPEAAAAVFNRGQLGSRVRREYAPRLGGQWDLTGSGPIGAWHVKTAALRNRVTHAGYVPSLAEAKLALENVLKLEVYLIDLVCAPQALERYIKTALEMTGTPGIERRGRLNKRFQQLIDSVLPGELDIFHDWAETVTSLRT